MVIFGNRRKRKHLRIYQCILYIEHKTINNFKKSLKKQIKTGICVFWSFTAQPEHDVVLSSQHTYIIHLLLCMTLMCHIFHYVNNMWLVFASCIDGSHMVKRRMSGLSLTDRWVGSLNGKYESHPHQQLNTVHTETAQRSTSFRKRLRTDTSKSLNLITTLTKLAINIVCSIS